MNTEGSPAQHAVHIYTSIQILSCQSSLNRDKISDYMPLEANFSAMQWHRKKLKAENYVSIFQTWKILKFGVWILSVLGYSADPIIMRTLSMVLRYYSADPKIIRVPCYPGVVREIETTLQLCLE